MKTQHLNPEFRYTWGEIPQKKKKLTKRCKNQWFVVRVKSKLVFACSSFLKEPLVLATCKMSQIFIFGQWGHTRKHVQGGNGAVKGWKVALGDARRSQEFV